MKRMSLIAVILLLVQLVFAQFPMGEDPQVDTESVHSAGDVAVFLSPNVIRSTPHPSIFAGGLKMRMFVGKRFSFDSDLMIGRNYLHFAPGLLGLPLWFFGTDVFLNSSGEINPDETEEGLTFQELLFIGAIMILSAEHFAYHFPVHQNTEISPYISFLRIKNITGLETNSSAESVKNPVAFAVGLELNHYLKRFVVSPYIEYDRTYSAGFQGINAGIYLGWYFPYD